MKNSRPNISRNLQKILLSHLKGKRRLAIIGVGSEFRGDDAVGSTIADTLIKKHKTSSRKKFWAVYNGATAPENLTGEIKRFKPSHLIIVDTVDIGAAPATVVVLEGREVSETAFFSTHKLPIKVMVQYLKKESRVESIVIGIQPKGIEFGKPLSREVRSVAGDIVSALADVV